jgi:hypothetical protein
MPGNIPVSRDFVSGRCSAGVSAPQRFGLAVGLFSGVGLGLLSNAILAARRNR